MLVEPLQHADVRQAARAAAPERHADRTPAGRRPTVLGCGRSRGTDQGQRQEECGRQGVSRRSDPAHGSPRSIAAASVAQRRYNPAVARFVFRGFETRTGCLANLVARVILVAGLVLSAVVIVTAGRSLRLTFGAKLAEGVVVRQREELKMTSVAAMQRTPGAPEIITATRLYRAVVAFRDGGRAYEVTSRDASPVQVYPIGTKPDVAFPPGHPERARLRAELPSFWLQSGLLLVGVLIGAGAVWSWWRLSHGRATITPLPGGRSDVSGG